MKTIHTVMVFYPILFLTLIGPIKLWAQMVPSYTFQNYSLDTQSRIITDRSHENYTTYQTNVDSFCLFLNLLSGSDFNLNIGEETFLLSINGSEASSPYSSCETYKFEGTFNMDDGSVAEILFYNDNIYINLSDTNRCISLKPITEELTLPGVLLLEELPCVNSDPESGTPSLSPVNCIINLEVALFTDSSYLGLFGSLDNLAIYVDRMLNGPALSVSTVYSQYIKDYNGVGSLKFSYVFKTINNKPKIILLPNKVNPLEADTKLEDYLNLNFPCRERDIVLYFTDQHLSVTTGTGRLQCHSAGHQSPITITLAYEPVYDKALKTCAHELGHYFSAGHLQGNNPNLPCYCEPFDKYLMCSNAPGLIMDNCSWFSISNTMNDFCACLSDSHSDSCSHCTFDIGVSSNISPLFYDSPIYTNNCKDASEFTITAFIHNDCTQKIYQSIKLSYSKGNTNHTRDKLIVLDPINFTGGIDSTSNNELNFLILNGPIILAPEQRIELKCKLKLLEIGTNNGSENTGISIYNGNISLKSSGIPIFNPTSYYRLNTTDNASQATITGLINANKQINSTACSQGQFNLLITRDITVNTNHYFTRNHIYLNEGKKITVASGKTLTICNANINSCENFWNSINLESGAHLEIINSKINDADYLSISLGNNSINLSQNSVIDHCNHGIYSESSSTGLNLFVDQSKFSNITEVVCNVVNADEVVFNNSEFENIGAGIVIANSDAIVKSCKFTNVGFGYRGNIVEIEPFTGNGILFNGNGQFKLSTILNPDPHVSRNSFNNLNAGIVISNGKFDLQGNGMENNQFGIQVQNSPTSGNIIANNDITSDFLGINLQNNGNLSTNIENNQNIKCLATYGSALQVGGNFGSVQIKNNLITNETGQAGIISNTCSNVTIKNNTVYTNSSNSTRTDAIYIVNSNNCDITCNKVSCLSLDHSTTAIEIQESPFCNVSCNEMQGAYCGLVFAGSCNPNIVGENRLGDHGLGLVLVTRAAGGDGIIGPQTHMGNHITGCGSDADAVNYGLRLVVLQSQFLVSPSSPYLPNNINNLVTQEWFLIPQQGTEYNCASNNICPNGIGARVSTDQINFNLNSDLIYNNIGLDYFDEVRTWSARKNILEYLKSRNSNSEEGRRWLSSFANTSLDLYSDIGVFCNETMPQSDQLKILLSQYNDLKINFNSKAISDLKIQINKELKKLLFQRNNKIDQFLSLLLQENPVTNFEQNQKHVSMIRLKQIKDPVGYLNSELSLLTKIANKCPYSDGNAVYEARMLLGNIKPILVNEADVCGMRENRKPEEKDLIKSILVYPNPSDQNIHIALLGSNERKTYIGKVMDLNGKIILKFPVSNSCDLSISELDSGMYIISINQNPQWTTKLFIQK